MTHRAALLTIACLACGSGSTPRPADPVLDSKPPAVNTSSLAPECQAGDQAACVRLAQQSCGSPVWQLEYDDLPTIYLAANGLIRVDYYGIALIGTNAHDWIACLEQCPGGGVQNVCIPFGFDLSFAMAEKRQCERRSRNIHKWNALEAKSLLIDCPSERAEITYVPELAPVQRALVAAGVIAGGDSLAKLDGLMVKLSIGGDTEVSLDRISKGHCSVFAVPRGYRLIAGAGAFARMRKLHPTLQAAFKSASATLVQEKIAEARAIARKRIDAEVARLCGVSGKDSANPEKLRACARNLEGLDALETKIYTRETARMIQSLTPKLEAVLRREYIKPVCDSLAARPDR